MTKIDLYISNTAPNARNAAWLKPTKNGFVLKIVDGGVWKDLVLGQENTSNTEADALEKLKAELIGSVQDKKTANTINGAKALAKEIQKQVNTLVEKAEKK